VKLQAFRFSSDPLSILLRGSTATFVAWCLTGVGVVLALSDPRPAQTSKAVVVGTVRDRESGDAVGNAVVRLVPVKATVRPSDVRGIIADAKGRFVFTATAAGSYRLEAEQTGFFPTDGLGAETDWPTVSVAANSELVPVDVYLLRASAIQGAVFDDAGEPVGGITVKAYRRVIRNNRELFDPSASSVTNDRGQYRLSPIKPAEYLLTVPIAQFSVPSTALSLATAGDREKARIVGSAVPQELLRGASWRNAGDWLFKDLQRGLGVIVGSEGQWSTATAFYNEQLGSSKGELVQVAPGETLNAINFFLVDRPARPVAGQLSPAMPAIARLFRLDPDDVVSIECLVASSVSNDTGRFELIGITAGEYVINVATDPSRSAGPHWATQSVLLSDASSSISVSLHAGLDIPIHVVAPEAKTGDKAPTAILWLERADGVPNLDGTNRWSVVTASTERLFSFQGIPRGRYYIHVEPANGWFLQAVMSTTTDEQRVLDLTQRDQAEVRATLSRRAPGVTGTVKGATQRAFVLLFPTRSQVEDRGSPPEAPLVITTDKGGGFAANGIYPDRYAILAVDHLPRLTRLRIAELRRRATVQIDLRDAQSIVRDLTLERVR
jgi:hypothetical protein